ncbi:MAG TPA: helix-turn-helix transcriptional regulator [Candidatus Limnocylindrales bacterium]
MPDAVHKQLYPYQSERGEQPPHPDFAMVGARFRNGRHQAGLSQRRLADKAGISQSVVSRFERGLVRKMSAERIVRLALALGPRFPFGCCPHDDGCPWPRVVTTERSSFWDLLNG